MNNIVSNFIEINNFISSNFDQTKKNKIPQIIAVSKTFPMTKIKPLIDYGHRHFGENKVQEAAEKWSDIKLSHPSINLHLIGKLQTNKVRIAINLFDYIHSLDTEKLAKKIANEQKKSLKKVKIFIQLNIGNESQKSGLNVKNIDEFYFFCKELNLDIIGLMCIPPADKEPNVYFEKMLTINQRLKLNELSMGMSSDYKEALKFSSTFVRIGSNIFGNRD